MNYIIGDICNIENSVIAHQCNCVTQGRNTAKGLARTIFKKFPYADIYAERKSGSQDIPGTVFYRERPGSPLVIALLGQRYPGKPRPPQETVEDRLEWMRLCLGTLVLSRNEFKLQERGISIPYGIGAGLAGGKWKDYEKLFSDFELVSDIPLTVVTLPQFSHLIPHGP